MAIPLPSPAMKRLRLILGSSIITAMLGVCYAVLFVQAHPHAIINGIIGGFVIGFLGSCAEVYFFGPTGRRLRFAALFVVRTIFYVGMIATTMILVIAVHQTHMDGSTFSEVLASERFRVFLYDGELYGIILYALVGSGAINFMRQVNRLLGRNVLLNLITGKYHQPVEEERVFMFLDLKASTTTAEKLGNNQYHRFLREFFFDISPAIIETKGQIYQYVGDEVVVTWQREDGLRNANCLMCYFRIVATILLRREHYQARYGTVPEFKAGFHYGRVIAGEIGDIKKDIVFHGDAINTAARIRSECTVFGKNLLLSGDLLGRLAISGILSPERIGKIRLRGKEEEVELYTIQEAA